MSCRVIQRSHRLSIFLAAVSLGAATAAAAPRATSAEPGGDPPVAPEGDALVEAQRKDELRLAADAVNLYDHAGYGKVALDFETRQVTVFWKGEPPNEVASQLGVHDDGVEVSLTPVPYADAELIAAGQRLFEAGWEKGGIPIQSVTPTADMSVLLVEIAPPDLGDVGALKTGSAGRVDLNETLSEIAGVPARATEGWGVVATTRQNDSPPWQGGGAMR
jgi:hypothetical protein